MKETKKSITQIVRALALSLLIVIGGFNLYSATKSFDKSNELIEPDTLKLTADESFFAPVGTLKAHLLDKGSGKPYNKNENYDYIHNWKNLGDTILFAVHLKKSGFVSIRPEMKIHSSQNGAKIYVYLGDERKELTVSNSNEENHYSLQNAVIFENAKDGFNWIKFQIKSVPVIGEEIGRLKNVDLSGSAIEGAEIEMRRYRPFAVHCSWETESDEPIEISVHELTVINTSVNCYQPITTPFGYTGSPWSMNTQTFGGYNFSLWSYGAKETPPPFYQESHLIAVGPNLTFGSYGHEGTGVKPRGDHPYMGVDSNKQIIAVRKSPGKIYDTYWSYYLDPKTGHWKLYGCGKKFNKKGTIEYLKTGAFVEVAGPASRERSGHVIRETQYAGWQMDTSGKWHPINKMIGRSRVNDLSFREWRTVGNKFSMRMGGFGELGNSSKTVILNNPNPVPEYLKGAFVDELFAMPANFIDKEPTNVNANSAIINVNVQDLGTNAKAQIFWGLEEGLTKEDKWEHKKSIEIVSKGNKIILEDLSPNKTYFYRIKITNDQGIVWSNNTQTFSTLSAG